MPRVYSTGSILVDLTVDVPALPTRGSDVIATGTRTVTGGGFNLAAAAARQGVECTVVAPIGDGPYGTIARAALAAEGIAASAPHRAGGDTGFCVTLVEPDGERTFVTMPGIESAVDPADLAAIGPQPGDVVAVSGYDLIYPGSGPVLAGWLPTLPDGVLVALDPGPLVDEIPAERLAVTLARTDVLTLNLREAGLLVGAEADVVAAVRTLVPGVVVVRAGADGCVATGGELGSEVLVVPAPRVAVVDTTGAGDTHTGVLLAELARRTPLREALERATAAAAVSVTQKGPATAPHRA